MSSPVAALRSPFHLSHASPLQSALLSLPLEIRYNIYAEIFQPRTYHYEKGIGVVSIHHEGCERAIPKTCRSKLECFLSHNTCRCLSAAATSLLQTCQQIYTEAQPHFLLSATLELHELPHVRRFLLTKDKADQLTSFYRKFLRSSLSGLVPADCLRRLDLTFALIPNKAIFDNLKAINDCRLRLDCLRLRVVNRSIPSYCNEDFISSYLFRGLSVLRDIKNVYLKWSSISRTLVRALDEPKHFSSRIFRRSDFPDFEAYVASVQKTYCDLLNCAFSEITSPPRATKGRKRFATLHKEARAIFLNRMQELMEESRLYLAPDP